MTLHQQSASANVDLLEVIDGIYDAHTITSDKKLEFLLQIENEGGVVSESLRKQLKRMFEQEMDHVEQAEQELQALRTFSSQKSQTESNDQPARDLVSKALEEQENGMEKLRQTIATVLGDVQVMERDATAQVEQKHRATDTRTIQSIRDQLQSSDDNSSTSA